MEATSGRVVLGVASGRATRRAVAAGALATCVLLAAGCLDFDEQEVRVAYDGKRDRLDAQLVYRGLGSMADSEWIWSETPSEVEDVKGTERQLDQLLSGRPLVATGWPLVALLGSMEHFDLAALRESEDSQVAELATLITVELGAPFRDDYGRLCGWQHVSVRDVHRAFELFDGVLRTELENAEEAARFRRRLGCESRVSAALWVGALQKRVRWFEEVDGTLLWHVPASEGDALALIKRIEKAPSIDQYLERRFAVRAPGSVKSAAEGEAVRVADVKRGGEGLVVLLHALGVTGRRTTSGVDLLLWDSKRELQDVRIAPGAIQSPRWDLAPYLEKRRVAVRTDVTDETLRADFDERRAR